MCVDLDPDVVFFPAGTEPDGSVLIVNLNLTFWSFIIYEALQEVCRDGNNNKKKNNQVRLRAAKVIKQEGNLSSLWSG